MISDWLFVNPKRIDSVVHDLNPTIFQMIITPDGALNHKRPLERQREAARDLKYADGTPFCNIFFLQLFFWRV